MTAQETFVTNAAETTLSSSLAAGATTINVTSSSAFPPVPFYAVIDPDVNTSREIILVDSAKTATTFTLTAASKRGQDGTTDTSHSSGAKVVCVPVAALWTDINDRVDASYNPGGTDVAVADGGTGASTAAVARTNLGLVIGTNVYGPGSTDVAVADGGTGASDAATARTNLGAHPAASVAARAFRSASTQSIPNDAFTAIQFTAESFDSDTIHDNTTNPSRFTVPAGQGGIWLVSGQINFNASGTGRRGIGVYVNGVANSQTILGNAGTGVGTSVSASVVLSLSAGDYVEIHAFQDSGAALAVNVGAAITWGAVARLGA